MDYFICQGSMRKLISILSIIDTNGIRTYGVSIDKILDKYKLFVLMSNADISVVRDLVSKMEDF